MRIIVFSTRRDERASVLKAMSASGHEVQFEEVHLNERSASLAKGFDAVAAFVNDQLNEACIRCLADLGIKCIALRCAGFNNVDLQTAKDVGIPVVRVPAYSPFAVAEHALTLLMTLNRHVHKAYNRVRDGNFSLDGLVGRDIHGKTVGVIGTGTIGAVFCNLMSGFGCQILACDPNPNESLIQKGVTYVDQNTLFAKSDFISLHCPLSPETHHVIDAQALDRFKPGAVLINTSRGGLVDTQAVIQALKSGSLGGLALDVYEEEAEFFFEDLSDNVIADDNLMRLTTFPNVIITGHQAFLTHEAQHNIAMTTASNLTDIQLNMPCINQL